MTCRTLARDRPEEQIAKPEGLVGEIGLADASLVVLATGHGVTEPLTFDERHFHALRGPEGRTFRILPADACRATA